MKYTENPTSKTAMAQALRYEFNLRPHVIAELLGIDRGRVSHVTTGAKRISIIGWNEREQREAAIENARQILARRTQ